MVKVALTANLQKYYPEAKFENAFAGKGVHGILGPPLKRFVITY